MPRRPASLRPALATLALPLAALAVACSGGFDPAPEAPRELAAHLSDAPRGVWLLREDGTQARSLAADHAEPVWRADGQRLLVTQGAGTGRRLVSMSADGASTVVVAELTASGGEAAWSPDGQRVAFVTGAFGSRKVVVANADGTGQRELPGAGEQRGPTWSPDGRRIAYFGSAATPNGPGMALYVVDAAGGTPAMVGATYNGREPAWSPDGARIAYAFGTDIYTVRPDGGAPERLVQGGERLWEPAWSSDGRRLAYTAGERTQGVSQLFVVDAVAGATPRAVLPRSTVASSPSWRP